MLITRQSPRTGQDNTLDLPITDEQWREYQTRPVRGGKLIQDIFPNLTDAQREFIMTGFTEEDWAAIFPPEEA